MCYPCTMCGQCGKPRMRYIAGKCPTCGHMNPEDALVCESCGKPFPPSPGDPIKIDDEKIRKLRERKK